MCMGFVEIILYEGAKERFFGYKGERVTALDFIMLYASKMF